MRKKLVLVIFIILTAVLVLAVIGKDYLSEPQDKSSAARLVIPRSGQEEADKDVEAADLSGDSMLGSLIPLRSDEILLKDVLTADYDGDSYEDQIAVIPLLAALAVSGAGNFRIERRDVHLVGESVVLIVDVHFDLAGVIFFGFDFCARICIRIAGAVHRDLGRHRVAFDR